MTYPNTPLLEIILSTIITAFFEYLAAISMAICVLLGIIWIIGVVKYLFHTKVYREEIMFDSRGITKDKNTFWAWEDIEGDTFYQHFYMKKISFLQKLPSFFDSLYWIIKAYILLTLLSEKLNKKERKRAEKEIDDLLRLKSFFYFSFRASQNQEEFIFRDEESVAYNISQFFEKYRNLHQFKQTKF